MSTKVYFLQNWSLKRVLTHQGYKLEWNSDEHHARLVWGCGRLTLVAVTAETCRSRYGHTSEG